MPDKNQKGMEQLDLKLVLSFTYEYEKLHEKGEISKEQLDDVLTLLDTYQEYTVEDFETKLNKIFNKVEKDI